VSPNCGGRWRRGRSLAWTSGLLLLSPLTAFARAAARRGQGDQREEVVSWLPTPALAFLLWALASA
jgi:hypothetical protein